MGRAGGRGGKARACAHAPRPQVLVSRWSTTMCGPLSHPASSEHHASLNGKTDAPLLIAWKPGKKGSRNKGTRTVGRGPLTKVTGAMPGWVYSSSGGGQWSWQVRQKDEQEDRAGDRRRMGLSVEVDEGETLASWGEHYEKVCPTFWVGWFIDGANNGTLPSKRGDVIVKL